MLGCPWNIDRGVPVASGEIVYVYDEVNRLTGVIDVDGSSAVYEYDSVGNLLSISRRASSVLSIIDFTPKRGAVGTVITIQGTGFNPILSDNRVTFNGIDSTVISATTVKLVATLPDGAATGPIAVITQAGSITSRVPFSVLRSTLPSITGFSPSVGTPGTAVTISGVNFETVIDKEAVLFSGTRAAVRSTTPELITAVVPFGTGSGRIVVVKSVGEAESNEDFVVPPPPSTAADIESIGRMMVGESVTVTIAAADKIALILFDGHARQRVSLEASGATFALATISILDVDGTTLLSQPIGTGQDVVMGPIALRVSGTLTVVIDPVLNNGGVTLTLHDVPLDVTESITVDGLPVTVDLSAPGQNAQVSFVGTGGQRVNLGIRDVKVSPATGFLSIFIISPDGSTLNSIAVTAGGGDIDTDPLPAAGAYTVLIDPQEASTTSLTLTLSEPIAGTLSVGGPPVVVTVSRPGQNGRFRFSGTAGQAVNLAIAEVSLSPPSGFVAVTIRKPDDTSLESIAVGIGGGTINTDPLPTSGTYTVVVNPESVTTASITLRLT
jgi:YD repeat-containing protein